MNAAHPMLEYRNGAIRETNCSWSQFVIERADNLISMSGITRPPFLPDSFAHLQKVKRIIRADLGELDALLLRLENGYLIKLNATQHPFRQNFSCAHEIAHTFLLDTDATAPVAKKRTSGSLHLHQLNEEVLCNLGAREILMPKSVFSDYAQRSGFSLRSVPSLAHTFQASITATARRLAEVSPEPLIAIFWAYRNTPTSNIRKLRVAWSIQSNSARRQRRYFLPRLASIGSGSGVAHAYSSDDYTSKYEDLTLGNLVGRYYVESKGFGHGPNRAVVSFVFLKAPAR
jgi:Zn-dependent peptidase ImmA (M78 family)